MNRTATTVRRLIIALFALGILSQSIPAFHSTPVLAEQGGKIGTGG